MADIMFPELPKGQPMISSSEMILPQSNRCHFGHCEADDCVAFD
ncbi:hypothetical protein NYF23_06950 [SAR92 clade bacterium H455]|uniref:Uncharacterized protein n=1 Tax=SAR92 clade bacterium H455 TaxID=2974818 RepID=A0ABY5TKT6_9GAMM|nr:hypothetical protein NYF23_06950 [SAR92 clade bacterium H455]